MNRQTLKPGSSLLLGGISYEIEGVEGCGSSAVVYRASYRDALSPDALHHVLLKELFPFSETGAIYRAADASVACTQEGRAQLDGARRRFLLGNEVNLALLSRAPAGTSGNLNSFEAYGTYYSVLAVHGGENLLTMMERRGPIPLREAIAIEQKLLDALALFHENGLLHLDISPDNILLLPSYALLIDFNSVWDTRGANGEDFTFSRKPGYSAPEVLLQNFRDIGFATDLYACCAVFFHLLTGRRLREEETVGGYLRRTLAGELRCLRDVPQTAAAKTVQILLKGLHTLSRKRYQSVDELRAELAELLRRLDGCGVTESALWEASAALCRRQKDDATAYLAQPVRSPGGTLSREALLDRLGQGEGFLLTGPGGMGKTRLLSELWRQTTAAYRPGSPVFLRLSLREYQETGGEAYFLRRSLLRLLQFPPEHAQYQDALHRLESLLDEAGTGGRARVVLLLDGLNEAGRKCERLLAEIEGLAARPGVGTLVTDRSDAVLSYALGGFSALSLAPLSREQVEAELGRSGLAVPTSQSLSSLFATPMLLFLYRDACLSGAQDGGAAVETMEELVSLYLERFALGALRADAGDQGRQLCTRYLLEHLLPDIAGELQRKDRTLLSFEELCRVSDLSYRRLRSRAFGAAFPAFRGKTRVMLEGIAGAAEWYDFAVNERLTDKLGLLVPTAGGHFSLLHDNFLPVLAARARENRRQFARGCRLVWRGPAIAALAVLLAAAGTGAALSHIAARSETQAALTQEEQGLVYDAVSCLNTSLGKWSSQIAAQREILERASISDVLDNSDAGALAKLDALIGQKEQFLAAVYASPLDETLAASLRGTEAEKPLFSVDTLELLCGRYAEMESVTAAALPQLRDALCSPDSVYDSRDKRERLILAYQDYLDAETRYVSYLLASLLAELPEENQADVLSVVTYLEAFADFYDGAGSVSPERLPDGTQRALEALKAARTEMSAQGYLISWPQP